MQGDQALDDLLVVGLQFDSVFQRPHLEIGVTLLSGLSGQGAPAIVIVGRGRSDGRLANAGLANAGLANAGLSRPAR